METATDAPGEEVIVQTMAAKQNAIERAPC